LKNKDAVLASKDALLASKDALLVKDEALMASKDEKIRTQVIEILSLRNRLSIRGIVGKIYVYVSNLSSFVI